MVRTAVDRFGGLHRLVTAAGLLRRRDVAGMTDEQLNDMLSISFLATFATCAPRRASCRPILHRWHTGRERGAHYAAAKGAVLAFTKSLAEELAPRSE